MPAVREIDWCVAFNGINVDVLSRLFFSSLFKYCNPVYTRLVNFHLVDNGGARASVNLEYGPIEPTWYVLDKNWKANTNGDKYYAQSVLNPWEAAEYMVENCGVSNWCIISHFDVYFKDDILARFIERMSENVGIIGTHCPIMAVNRRAYKFRRFGFKPGRDCDVGIMLERDLESQGWRRIPFDENMSKCFHHFGGGASHHNRQEYESMRKRAMSITFNK